MKSNDSENIPLFKHVNNIFYDFISLNMFDGKSLKFSDVRVRPRDLDDHRGNFNFAIVKCRGDLKIAILIDNQFFDCAEFDTDPLSADEIIT
jgi:hypothetical protein